MKNIRQNERGLQYLRRCIYGFRRRSGTFHPMRSSVPFRLPQRMARKVLISSHLPHLLLFLLNRSVFLVFFNLRRSKTCPQCRSHVNEYNTVKLYFQVNSNQHSQTPRVLENEIATLKRQMMLRNLDLLEATKQHLVAQELANNLQNNLR